MKNCIFVVTQLSQPRCIKRMTTLYKTGVPIKIYGFDSGLCSENIANFHLPITEIIKNTGKNKISRFIFIIKTVRRIIKSNPYDDIFYLFGFEIASLARMLGCKRYIYEEADISAVKKHNSFIRKILLSIDRRTISKSLLTVFTSQGFVKYIFNKKQPSNVILIPNKLSDYFNHDKRDKILLNRIDINHIKFAFIGHIRYPNTIIRFARVIGRKFPQHEFCFYGDIACNWYIDDEIRSFPNIHFYGSFANPYDLEQIYSNIDINIVCYDTSSINVKIAEPNKLYESIYFGTPIIVSKGTFLEEKVNTLQVGKGIDAFSDEAIIDFVMSLNEKELQKYVYNMKKIDSQYLIDDPKDLLSRIKYLFMESEYD